MKFMPVLPAILIAVSYWHTCHALANNPQDRRAALTQGGSLLVSSAFVAVAPIPAVAAVEQQTQQKAQSLPQVLSSRVQGIPTFCIVNPEGASYMVLQRNIAIGYAFLTFEGAFAVLKDAQKTAQEGGYFDMWENASITTIPLDAAIRLSLRNRERLTPKDRSLASTLRVIPGGIERLDAVALDKRFDQQGRVPLFYVDLPRNTPEDELVVYFSRRDLVREWSQSHPGEGIPPVKALDLETVFNFAYTGRGKELPTTNIRFVPMEQSVKAAKELAAQGLAPYNPKKMVI